MVTFSSVTTTMMIHQQNAQTHRLSIVCRKTLHSGIHCSTNVNNWVGYNVNCKIRISSDRFNIRYISIQTVAWIMLRTLKLPTDWSVQYIRNDMCKNSAAVEFHVMDCMVYITWFNQFNQLLWYGSKQGVCDQRPIIEKIHGMHGKLSWIRIWFLYWLDHIYWLEKNHFVFIANA